MQNLDEDPAYTRSCGVSEAADKEAIFRIGLAVGALCDGLAPPHSGYDLKNQVERAKVELRRAIESLGPFQQNKGGVE